MQRYQGQQRQDHTFDLDQRYEAQREASGDGHGVAPLRSPFKPGPQPAEKEDLQKLFGEAQPAVPDLDSVEGQKRRGCETSPRPQEPLGEQKEKGHRNKAYDNGNI